MIETGTVTEISSTSTKTGKTAAMLSLKTDRGDRCIYYCDTETGNSGSLCLSRKYLRNQTVMVSYEEKNGIKYGRLLPTNHELVRIPATLKPAAEEDKRAFLLSLQAAKDCGEIDNISCDIQNPDDIQSVYRIAVNIKSDACTALKEASMKLFNAEKYNYIGPIGFVHTFGSKKWASVSFPLPHAEDESSVWRDIVFWNTATSETVCKNLQRGDHAVFWNMMQRESDGKVQYSCDFYRKIPKKARASEESAAPAE